jgi:hypothetical protein
MDVLDEQNGADVLPLEATTSSQVPINNTIPQPRAVRTQPSCEAETEQQQRTMNTALNASDSICVRLFGRLKGMTVSAVVFDSAACPQFHGCAHKFVELHISILGCIRAIC